MAGINKVILIGNLGRDPELRYTQGGTAVATLNIATTRSFTRGQGKDAERVEETEWHRVVVWGKTAEFCNQYLAKGRQVYVEGRLQTRSYEDKDGAKRHATEVVAETVQFLGGRGGDGGGEADGGGSRGGGQGGRSSSGGGRSGGRGGSGGGSRGRQPGEDDEPFDNYIPSPDDDSIPF